MGKGKRKPNKNILADLDRVLIEEGEYLIQVVEVGKAFVFQWDGETGKAGSPSKMTARCLIIDGPHQGTELPLYLNLKLAGGKVPQGSKYYEAWFVANGCQKPRRRELSRMPAAIFAKKIFRARVRTVKRNADGSEKHSELCYSRVDRLLGLEAGGKNRSADSERVLPGPSPKESLSHSVSDSRSNSSSNLGIQKEQAGRELSRGPLSRKSGACP